jgi:hypothetical protein
MEKYDKLFDGYLLGFLFHPQGGGSRINKFIPCYTASHPRRQHSIYYGNYIYH